MDFSGWLREPVHFGRAVEADRSVSGSNYVLALQHFFDGHQDLVRRHTSESRRRRRVFHREIRWIEIARHQGRFRASA
jgi:hypothetical protein